MWEVTKKIAKVKASECSVIKIDAGNDTNGNPRRGWLILTPSQGAIGFVNEGYRGMAAFDDIFETADAKALKAAASHGGSVKVSPSEYRDHKKSLSL